VALHKWTSSEKRRGAIRQGIEAQLEGELEQAFLDAGWVVSRPEPVRAYHFLVERGRRRYAVELKAAADARRPILQAFLADAVLRARCGAAPDRAEPLAVVGAPSISDAVARDVDTYASAYAGGSAYGIIDAEGRLRLHGPGLAKVQRERDPRLPSATAQRGSSFDPFSDLNQWMLKVLLASHLPDDWLTAPRKTIDKPARLGAVADVSSPSSFRLVTYLRAEGFVPAAGALHLSRIPELLTRWKEAARRTVPVEKPMRWSGRPRDLRGKLDDTLRRYAAREMKRGAPRVCLGLFAAADHLGFPFVTGVAPHLHVERLSPAVLDALGLSPSDHGQGADVIVRPMKCAESIFRGAVLREGVPTCDVLQAWLDVGSHAARGDEQADYLFRKALRPRLLGAVA
jgi:hypothetical protein